MNKTILFYLLVLTLTIQTSCSYQCFQFESLEKTDIYLKIHGLPSLSSCANNHSGEKVYLGIYLLKNNNRPIKANTANDISSLILGKSNDSNLIYIKKITVKPNKNQIIHLQNEHMCNHIFVVAGFCKRSEEVCTKKIDINFTKRRNFRLRMYPILKCLVPCEHHIYIGNGKFDNGWNYQDETDESSEDKDQNYFYDDEDFI